MGHGESRILEEISIAASGLDALDFSLGQGPDVAVHRVLEGMLVFVSV